MTTNRHLSPYEINHLRTHLGYLPNTKNIGNSPVEYLTHHAEFMDLDFFVNPSVLIPRIDSEKIIHLSLQHFKNHYPTNQTINILDLATGSGCLGISLYHHLQKLGYKKLNLILSDISPQALSVTKHNLHKLLPTNTNITLVQSNLFQNLPHNLKFNLIISNPPYIPTNRILRLDSSVRDFEPYIALDGGQDGAILINQIIQNLSDHLKPKGVAFIEIDHTHISDSFQIPPSLKPQIIPDDQKQNRFLFLQKID